MSLLTQKDLQSILKFLQELHTLCSLEDLPDHAVSILPKAIPSEFTGFVKLNFQKSRVSIGSTSRAIDYSDTEEMFQKYFYEHPVMTRYFRTGDSQAYTLSDFLSENQLHHSEGLYHKFLKPLGMEDQLGFILPTSQVADSRDKLFGDQKVDISMSLHRPERSFSDRDRFVLNLLRPHISQAYQNAQALTQMQQELARLGRIIEQSNTIVLTADGKVSLMSQRAWALLKHYFQLPYLPSFHLPEPLHQWVKSQISLLTQTTDIPSPCLPLRLEWQSKQLLIRFIADRPGEQYLLLLEEQSQHTLSSASLELLGLTKREAEVLCWVTQGKTNMEIAAILSISELTIKKHLEHIYQKFGVQGRTAAVTYALDSLGMLRGDL